VSVDESCYVYMSVSAVLSHVWSVHLSNLVVLVGVRALLSLNCSWSVLWSVRNGVLWSVRNASYFGVRAILSLNLFVEISILFLFR